MAKHDPRSPSQSQLDEQTAYSKSVAAIAILAKKYKLPVLALTGGLGEQYKGLYDLGIDAITVLPSGPMPLVYAMEHAYLLTSEATERALKLLKMGIDFKKI